MDQYIGLDVSLKGAAISIRQGVSGSGGGSALRTPNFSPKLSANMRYYVGVTTIGTRGVARNLYGSFRELQTIEFVAFCEMLLDQVEPVFWQCAKHTRVFYNRTLRYPLCRT